MKENQNDRSNQDKTGKQSTQKNTTDIRKKETDPNNPIASPSKKKVTVSGKQNLNKK